MVSDAEKARVGALIRARRQELGLKQPEFARRVGVSRNAVSNWETGRTSPQRHAGKVEAVLRISLAGGGPDPLEREFLDILDRMDLTRRERDWWIKQYRSQRAGTGARQRAG